MNTKRRKQRRGKVFKIWLVYYSIILLLPIVLGLFVYDQTIDIITNESKNVRQASLYQIKTQIDAKLLQLRSVGSNTLLNEKIQSLGKMGEKLGAKEYYEMYELRKDLDKYLINNDFIKGIYIYFTRSGCMLSNTGTISKDDVASVVTEVLGLDLNQWQDITKTKQHNNYYIINENKGQRLLYMQTISINTSNRAPLITMIILTDTAQIINILSEVNLPPMGNAMILGENNIALSINTHSKPVKYGDLVSYESNNRLSKDNLAIIQLDSNVSKCKYILVLPYGYYLQRVQYIKNIIILYVVVCISFGFILAYYFSRRSYTPLQKLRMALEAQGVSNNDTLMDEFSLIEFEINELINKKEQLQNNLTDNKEIMRNNIIFGLLKGKRNIMYQKADDFSKYDLFFKSNSFAVVLMEIDNSGNKLFTEKEEEDVLPIVSILVNNVFKKIIGDKFCVYFVECDGQIAGIVNYNQDILSKDIIESTQYEMEQVTGTVIYYIKEHFDVMLSAAISNLHYGLKGIREAYNETVDIFEYKHLKGETIPIIRFDANIHASKFGLANSTVLDTERQFTDLMISGDYKRAYCVLKSIIDYYTGMGITSFHMVKFRIFGLVNIMLNVLGEIWTDSNSEFFEKLDPINRLLNANTLAEIQKETFFIMDSMIQYSEKENSNIKDKIEAVTSYIDHHYFETELSVKLLSDKFGMSISYLSRMYKKYTGEGLLDYIHKVRINKAKALLTGGMSIKVVAEKVGYYNSQALIRSFKRYEGITPGKFKAD